MCRETGGYEMKNECNRNRFDAMLYVEELPLPNKLKRRIIQGDGPDTDPSAIRWAALCGLPDRKMRSRLQQRTDLKSTPGTVKKLKNVLWCKQELDKAKIAYDNRVPDGVKELNEKYFIAREGKSVAVYWQDYDEMLNRKRWLTSSISALQQFHFNERVLLSDGSKQKRKIDVWLNWAERRNYDGLVFRPDQKPNAEINGKFNLWQGFNVGSKIGSCKLWKAHVREVICCGNNQYFDYLWKWLALCVQQPHVQGKVAVAMRGPRGTGKGMFASGFSEIFGQHFVHITSAKHLTGNFNSHMRDAIVLFADEVVMTGNKDARAVLQGYVTERVISIEGKGKDVIQVPNLMHILMATNERFVVPAGKNERRYFVLDVSPHRMRDRAYFNAIAAELADGGKAAILEELLQVDLEGFEVADYPDTQALVDQQIEGMEPLEAFFFGQLRAGELCNTQAWYRVARGDLYKWYSGFCHNIDATPEKPETVGRALKRWGAKAKRVQIAREDGKGYVNGYEFEDIAECQALFTDDLGWPEYAFDWNDDLDTPMGDGSDEDLRRRCAADGTEEKRFQKEAKALRTKAPELPNSKRKYPLGDMVRNEESGQYHWVQLEDDDPRLQDGATCAVVQGDQNAPPEF